MSSEDLFISASAAPFIVPARIAIFVQVMFVGPVDPGMNPTIDAEAAYRTNSGNVKVQVELPDFRIVTPLKEEVHIQGVLYLDSVQDVDWARSGRLSEGYVAVDSLTGQVAEMFELDTSHLARLSIRGRNSVTTPMRTALAEAESRVGPLQIGHSV